MFDFKRDFEIKDFYLKNFVSLTEVEARSVLEWRNHPEVRHQMYNEDCISGKEHLCFLESLEKRIDKFYWLVCKDGAGIGVIDIYNIKQLHKNVYFGIYANPQAKLPGVGRCLDDISLYLLFEIAGFNALRLEVIETNKKVINMHYKMGFHEEGILRDFVYKCDGWRNVLVMSQLKYEWKKRKTNINNSRSIG
ncbi:MAG: UDP-4-amino-4,6-dideoxy-N-acetyl-beta-L-altrosamine N-acetyltransferase [Candidatus Omnitrophica bacterium]|nr:UDP-4-amino-4,6-dideoxy-N-acetyl-beta-L-altrosamine N-acetyltransferase [Candidatus Omnitrophota bacterium]